VRIKKKITKCQGYLSFGRKLLDKRIKKMKKMEVNKMAVEGPNKLTSCFFISVCRFIKIFIGRIERDDKK